MEKYRVVRVYSLQDLKNTFGYQADFLKDLKEDAYKEIIHKAISEGWDIHKLTFSNYIEQISENLIQLVVECKLK